jgi:hypothetical protein
MDTLVHRSSSEATKRWPTFLRAGRQTVTSPLVGLCGPVKEWCTRHVDHRGRERHERDRPSPRPRLRGAGSGAPPRPQAPLALGRRWRSRPAGPGREAPALRPLAGGARPARRARGRRVTDQAARTTVDHARAAAAGVARWRVRVQQRAAVLGAGDPDALDAAILACRHSGGPRHPASGAGVPAWVFARWLCEGGPRAWAPALPPPRPTRTEERHVAPPRTPFPDPLPRERERRTKEARRP